MTFNVGVSGGGTQYAGALELNGGTAVAVGTPLSWQPSTTGGTSFDIYFAAARCEFADLDPTMPEALARMES